MHARLLCGAKDAGFLFWRSREPLRVADDRLPRQGREEDNGSPGGKRTALLVGSLRGEKSKLPGGRVLGRRFRNLYPSGKERLKFLLTGFSRKRRPVFY